MQSKLNIARVSLLSLDGSNGVLAHPLLLRVDDATPQKQESPLVGRVSSTSYPLFLFYTHLYSAFLF